MKRYEILKQIKEYYFMEKKSCICIIIISVGLYLLSFVQPYIYKVFIDKGLIGTNFRVLYIVIGASLLNYVVCSLLRIKLIKFQTKFRKLVTCWLKEKILEKFANMKGSCLTQFSIGEMKSIVEEDGTKVVSIICDNMINWSMLILFQTIYIVVLLKINAILTISSFLIIFLFEIGLFVICKKQRDNSEKTREFMAEYEGWLYSAVGPVSRFSTK